MLWKIPRCYDSHLHLMGSGMLQRGLRLFDLQKPEDVRHLQIEKHHFRGQWLVGFGWDQSKWPGQKWPTKEILDQAFPDFPVAFSRADGHATWLNSKALEIAGYLNKTEQERPTPAGSVIVRDENGFPTGVFTELVKLEVEMRIPPYTRQQNRDFLKEAVRYLNSRGFTHVRDMSGFIDQWNLLRDLDQNGELTLYIDENFTCENLPDFERALSEAKQARETQTPHLKARGIKFYFDGSLGSQGAYLSQFYPGTMNRGMTLWDLKDVEQVFERTWRAGFEVCVHTIGDEAAHLILQMAAKVKSEKKLNGVVNVEHAEVIRPETIALMKEFEMICHVQPCHWLTDRRWLKESLGKLYAYAFPWQALQKSGIRMQWGSDSPIEEASVPNNYKALMESPAEGIPAYQGDLLAPHSHRDEHWGEQCSSTFEDGRLTELIFDGKRLI